MNLHHKTDDVPSSTSSINTQYEDYNDIIRSKVNRKTEEIKRQLITQFFSTLIFFLLLFLLPSRISSKAAPVSVFLLIIVYSLVWGYSLNKLYKNSLTIKEEILFNLSSAIHLLNEYKLHKKLNYFNNFSNKIKHFYPLNLEYSFNGLGTNAEQKFLHLLASCKIYISRKILSEVSVDSSKQKLEDTTIELKSIFLALFTEDVTRLNSQIINFIKEKKEKVKIVEYFLRSIEFLKQNYLLFLFLIIPSILYLIYLWLWNITFDLGDLASFLALSVAVYVALKWVSSKNLP